MSQLFSSGHMNINGQPLNRRRMSSFTEMTSPHARRRSFMSKSMIENEKYQFYYLNQHDSTNSPCCSINLAESQGFVFNQDLFASSYQQARAGVSNDVIHPNSTSQSLRNLNSRNLVDVIDVVVNDDDYDSDGDVVKEVIKIGWDSDVEEDEEEVDFNDHAADFSDTYQHQYKTVRTSASLFRESFGFPIAENGAANEGRQDNENQDDDSVFMIDY